MVPPAAPESIRILLVDDHVVVRQGIRMLLENHPDLVVVGEASTGAEALRLAERERPSIVLLDLVLSGENGLDLILPLTNLGPDVRVLVLTGVRDTEQHQRAVRAGASGVVLKEHAGDLLIKAVRLVHTGEMWVDRGMTARLLQGLRQEPDRRPPDPEAERVASLTAREREIVTLVAQGFGTQKMADLLCISEKTVRNHLASIYSKLQVSERLELALYAVKHGLAPDSARTGTS